MEESDSAKGAWLLVIVAWFFLFRRPVAPGPDGQLVLATTAATLDFGAPIPGVPAPATSVVISGAC